MAKISSVKKNQRRIRLSDLDLEKRKKLKSIVMDKTASIEDRFNASLSLAKMRRNGAKVRVRNRCELTGRSRGFYRKFKISRICLRFLANEGKLPGVLKSSW